MLLGKLLLGTKGKCIQYSYQSKNGKIIHFRSGGTFSSVRISEKISIIHYINKFRTPNYLLKMDWDIIDRVKNDQFVYIKRNFILYIPSHWLYQWTNSFTSFASILGHRRKSFKSKR